MDAGLKRAVDKDRELKKTLTKVVHKVGYEEWLAERLALLKVEKEHTRRGDELAAMRQELPWVRVEKEYRFERTTEELRLPICSEDARSSSFITSADRRATLLRQVREDRQCWLFAERRTFGAHAVCSIFVLGRGSGGQQLSAQRLAGNTKAVREEPEVTNADEAFGQHVQKEATQELGGDQRA